jgi:two-component system nitrate/nitrite response regulator NarL
MRTPAGPLSVLLVDDHPFVREGIRSFLAEAPGCVIAGEAGSGEEAIQLAEKLQPNFILLDINMPGANGLEIIGKLRRLLPDAKILVLTVHNSREYVLHVARSGAHGYILKEAPPAELLQAMRAIQGGEKYFGAGVAGHAVEKKEPALTPREVEVLILTAKGKGIKEIADALSISNPTVQTYRVRIMQKLKVHHVAGLVTFAIQKGYVTLDGPAS